MTGQHDKTGGHDPHAPTDELAEIRLWDPALRLFHWLLALAVLTGWSLGQFGEALGITRMTLHFWCGYFVIALLGFRLIWGLVGPKPARFTHFIRGPGPVLSYMGRLHRREPSHWPGHNPMGALAILAMLAALMAQIATGLIADPEDFINVGPLASMVSGATSRKAVGWHGIGGWVIFALVVLHVGMILFYRFWKREDLVRPMITGRKKVRQR